MNNEMVIKVTKTNGNVKDVISLVRTMVDRMGYVKAKMQLALVYNINITIDYKELL